jgi:hypothetical protein
MHLHSRVWSWPCWLVSGGVEGGCTVLLSPLGFGRLTISLPCCCYAAPQVDYLSSIGLKQDEICNMASISVVLLGLNPDTRLRPVVEYLKSRGVPEDSVADLVLRHPRIFEYKVRGCSRNTMLTGCNSSRCALWGFSRGFKGASTYAVDGAQRCGCDMSGCP